MPPSLASAVEADLQGRTTFDAKSMPSDSQVSGLRIVVTGGAGGIGEACCRRLITAGAWVVIADRSEEAGKALEKELGQQRAKFVVVDISSWMSQLELFRAAIQFFPGGLIDSLITCAGVISDSAWNVLPSKEPATLLEADLSTIPEPGMQCIDINLKGTMNSIHIATKYCMGVRDTSGSLSPGPKSIVLLGSTGGYRPMGNKTDYSIAKWGVRGVFKNLRTVLPRQGIRVNLMVPFWVPTKLTEGRVPPGIKVGKLDDVISGIVKMIVDSGMNGRAITVTAKGLEDIGDDLAGRDGGEAMFGLVRDEWLSVPESATMRIEPPS